MRSSSHWSGLSKKATMAPEIRFRVVSLPATVRSRKNNSSSKSESRSPSISTPVSTLIRSCVGIDALRGEELRGVGVQLHRGHQGDVLG